MFHPEEPAPRAGSPNSDKDRLSARPSSRLECEASGVALAAVGKPRIEQEDLDTNINGP